MIQIPQTRMSKMMQVQKVNHSSVINHQRTRDLLRDKFETLQITFNKSSVRAGMSGNRVEFRSERADMIMGYLIRIKDELNAAIN